MDRREWGVQVQIALMQKGITQKDLAGKLGLSYQWINNIINNNADSPAIETIKRISKILNVQVPDED